MWRVPYSQKSRDNRFNVAIVPKEVCVVFSSVTTADSRKRFVYQAIERSKGST